MNYFSTVSAVFVGIFAYDIIKDFAVYLSIKIEKRRDQD